MGVGYYEQLTQWSQGEYPGANNQQDDTAIIAARLGYRTDDHENLVFGAATRLAVEASGELLVTTPESDPFNLSPANKGVIERRSDVDLFYFDAAAGPVQLSVRPAWAAYLVDSNRGANLDVELTLYDGSGAVIAQSDPLDETRADLSTNVAGGRYYLAVAGVGNDLSPYSDYGSLGLYYISGAIAVGVPPEPPSAPSDLVATADGEGNVGLTWSDPASGPTTTRPATASTATACRSPTCRRTAPATKTTTSRPARTPTWCRPTMAAARPTRTSPRSR